MDLGLEIVAGEVLNERREKDEQSLRVPVSLLHKTIRNGVAEDT